MREIKGLEYTTSDEIERWNRMDLPTLVNSVGVDQEERSLPSIVKEVFDFCVCFRSKIRSWCPDVQGPVFHRLSHYKITGRQLNELHQVFCRGDDLRLVLTILRAEKAALEYLKLEWPCENERKDLLELNPFMQELTQPKAYGNPLDRLFWHTAFPISQDHAIARDANGSLDQDLMDLLMEMRKTVPRQTLSNELFQAYQKDKTGESFYDSPFFESYKINSVLQRFTDSEYCERRVIGQKIQMIRAMLGSLTSDEIFRAMEAKGLKNQTFLMELQDCFEDDSFHPEKLCEKYLPKKEIVSLSAPRGSTIHEISELELRQLLTIGADGQVEGFCNPCEWILNLAKAHINCEKTFRRFCDALYQKRIVGDKIERVLQLTYQGSILEFINDTLGEAAI